METAILNARGVSKCYPTPSARILALDAVDLSVAPGELVVVQGRSGSGKSTLLTVLGLLSRPDSGTVSISGRDTSSLSEEETAHTRSQLFGFVFQAYNLLGHLTAAENVALAVPGRGRAAQRRAADALADVGLEKRRNHLPTELSGGEQQRVAVARALVNRPLVLLADEPTGNLDADHEMLILDQLRAAAARGCAVVIVSHSDRVAIRADRRFLIDEGRIAPAISNASRPNASPQ